MKEYFKNSNCNYNGYIKYKFLEIIILSYERV